MSAFSHPEYDAHESVAFHFDPTSGLRAIIAVHNTNLGKALGGCRMWPYASDEDALTDVLRLSRGMTFKAALAGLPQGGGKSVIIGDPRRDKTPAMMQAMGRFINSLQGRYVVAEDSGIGVADVRIMARETDFASGFTDETCPSDGRTGDPSPATALGTFYGIEAAVKHRLGGYDLKGLRVAIQGVGNVGYHLARHLHGAGAELWVSDLHGPAVERCVKEFAAVAVRPGEIHALDVDVFSPCAMGAVLNDTTISELRAKIVAGAANNQLEKAIHGQQLMNRGVLYAPDYVINAGGIIDLFYEGPDYKWEVVDAHLKRIGTTLIQIFRRSDIDLTPPGEIADEIATAIFRGER